MEPFVPAISRPPSPSRSTVAIGCGAWAAADFAEKRRELVDLLTGAGDAWSATVAAIGRSGQGSIVVGPGLRTCDVEVVSGTPWGDCLRTGVAVDVVIDGHRDGRRVRSELSVLSDTTGARAVWCRPGRDVTGVVAVVVAFVPEARCPNTSETWRLERLADEVVTAIGGDAGVRLLIDPLTDAHTTVRLQRLADEGAVATAVAHLDIDGLDAINDAYGPRGGDDVLIEVAARLRRLTRSCDVVVRTGADEFVLVIRDAAELASIQVAARVLDELALPYAITTPDGGTALASITTGVGLCLQDDGTVFTDAVRAATRALREAKRVGRDRLHIVSC